ncbi:MAG TPA: tRNA (adenosine(37)-N6)-threonylcarbamoyltransferase complex ATPase subunit type 1 TsaE [Candidatus Binataceae bacterium]|nr:tRNA (adenosine(37)-N6)-threonylcarbamoyltransferase complex ATPase subunit type 1 TsaE [Candidatus Binataceae bacterium]
MPNQVEIQSTAVTFVIESASPHETKNWGRRLASVLEGGELLGLIGDLGAGKTCFIKGLARGLSLREEDILSPTFTMIQEHRGRLPLYHIDLYRLDEAGLDDLGLREYLFSEGIAAVEWFERLRESADLDYLEVRISYSGANSRRIEFAASGPRHSEAIARLRARFE